MAKRNKSDIVFDMLQKISEKQYIKPTRLMYAANLSHKQMKGYLEELIDKEMITEVEKKKSNYLILTEKGFDFLNKFGEMKEFERTFGF